MIRIHPRFAVLAIVSASLTNPAWADAVTDWNAKVGEIILETKVPTPVANRALAITQTAVYEAVNAITRRYPASGLKLKSARDASIEAAVAAVNRAVFSKLAPAQQASIDRAYETALAAIADGPAKASGIAVGEKAAAAIMAQRADDGMGIVETYRPYTSAGKYVPTVLPVASQWSQRKPWFLTSASQFRPGPPPALTSDIWARDFEEVKAIGSKNSTRRTAEQTQIARFWEATAPPIYHGLVRSVANAPGRDVTQNARLFAAVTQAAEDALIAVFDAKYHYGFWRPITAIRNADIDENDATARDPSWAPFIDTPMHPEYPCAHCIVSGAIGAVLQADIGSGRMPTLTTSSYTAEGAARSWANLEEFMQEVANARIYDGVHYRNSAEVGTAMGKQVGQLAVAKFLQPSK